MNAVLEPVIAPPGGQIYDFMQQRLERALRQRLRYRYVQPRVLREGDGFRVESPCCSRNVDPDGGVIDIALLQPAGSGPSSPMWRLYARDHAAGSWCLLDGSAELEYLLDVLCVDPQRRFWP